MQFPVPQKYTATVESLVRLDGEVYNVGFTLRTPPSLSFIAGQYGSFFVSPTVRRNYSFTSPPKVASHIETCVDLTPRGPGSQWLLSLKIGESVELLAPLGRFVVNKESQRKKVFVATGTGISATRSMILDVLEANAPVASVLYWGVRHEENMFWDEEFQKLAEKYSQFSFIRIVSQPQGVWKGRIGRVTDFVTKEEKDLGNSEFYLCGNRQMIYDMKELLLEQNVPEEQIKSELFY